MYRPTHGDNDAAFCPCIDLLYVLYDEKVKDGRWAYTNIPNVKDDNPGFLEPNVYGKLRSPWNTNDRA